MPLRVGDGEYLFTFWKYSGEMFRQKDFVIKWEKSDQHTMEKKSTQERMMHLRTFLINNVTKLLFWLLDFQYAKLWLKIRGFLHEHNENINHMDCSLSTAYSFYGTFFKLSKWTFSVFVVDINLYVWFSFVWLCFPVG